MAHVKFTARAALFVLIAKAISPYRHPRQTRYRGKFLDKSSPVSPPL
ncbi:hypothetical protein CAMRE0001_3094 [Campylobacter rectus RM3267]|uniref:Uncharacterized protein n=1 Tax=Campylobacter rectus RM3267 TaxID=553218 RepID=B9D4P9_CAMRE|nr:hypothetical protein CAMRE0001_3094 [Campylobacter rectus RM3267]